MEKYITKQNRKELASTLGLTDLQVSLYIYEFSCITMIPIIYLNFFPLNLYYSYYYLYVRFIVLVGKSMVSEQKDEMATCRGVFRQIELQIIICYKSLYSLIIIVKNTNMLFYILLAPVQQAAATLCINMFYIYNDFIYIRL